MADGNNFQPPVVFDLFNLCAQCVDMSDDGAGRCDLTAWQAHPYGTASGHFIFQPQTSQFATQHPDGFVGKTGRAGGVQKISKAGFKVDKVNKGIRHKTSLSGHSVGKGAGGEG